MSDHRETNHRSSGKDELRIEDLAGFVRRYWMLIAGAAVLAGVITGLGVILVVPSAFEAAATLVVVPSQFSSELKPQTLTIQGYQKLLESDAVLAEAKVRLVGEDVLAPDESLQIGENLRTRIFVSRRSEETELAPMIQAVATADTPDAAAAIANTWAEVFRGQINNLFAGSTSVTVAFIERQYPLVRDELAKAENARAQATDSFQERLDALNDKWDRTITEAKNDLVKREGAYRAESQKLVDSFVAEKNLATRAKRLEAYRTAYTDLQEEQARVDSLVEQRRLELDAARSQIAQTSEYLTLRKAITDDVLWEALFSENGKQKREAFEDQSLITQEINPVFTELTSRAATIEMDLKMLTPRAGQLEARLKQLAAQVRELELAYREDDSERARLVEERQSGLLAMRESGNLEVLMMKRRLDRELSSIMRARDTRLAQLDRDIEQQRDLFEELAKNFNQATLAKAQQDAEDVRMGAAAVAPETPIRRNVPAKSALGAMLGGLLGLMVALSRAGTT
jgi:uncharacterized protein involved in exopolysaccharide biosynthesis